MKKNQSMLPLVVDLDGTLVKLDTLFQAFFMLLRQSPLSIFKILHWSIRGRAYLKDQILSRIEIDPTTLPYQPEFLAFLKDQHNKGRPIVLATAASHHIAIPIAKYLGIFSDVLASDSRTNLKSGLKLEKVKSKYPSFAYAGNEKADLIIWEAAEEVMIVNPSIELKKRSIDQADRLFNDKQSWPKLVLKAIRIHQWIKNLLVFSPLIFAHLYNDLAKVTTACMAFFAFNFAASAIYILNDLLDLSADQHHPRKYKRPFAAGDLQIKTGLLLIPLLATCSILFSLYVPASFQILLGLYLISSILYSLKLKQIMVLDVLTLAILYTLRILAGGYACDITVSSWLIEFSIFMFLSLALVKRVAELRETRTDSNLTERGYISIDIPLLQTFGVCSGLISVFIFTGYLYSEQVLKYYKRPDLLWLFTPLLLYWITRIWMLAWRGKMKDDPVAFASTDTQSYLLGIVGFAILFFSIWP